MKALISRAVFSLYRGLPPGVRYRLKAIANINGHSAGALDTLKAMRDADGKKRLDRAMVRVVATMEACDISSLESWHCLEVGCGFAPADALCFFLLGAKSVLATDYNRILQFDALAHAVRIADRESLARSASQMVSAETFSKRLNRLHAALCSGEEGLAELGIRYCAPTDLSHESPGVNFDLIYSVCVMEHIPPAHLEPILRTLTASLSRDGRMLHDINLQDHLDEEGDPFAFLRRNGLYDPIQEIDARGNRVRFSQWRRLFDALAGFETKIVKRTIRPDARPDAATLLPEFAILDDDDRFTSRLLTITGGRPA